MPHADDHARDAGPIEDPPDGDGADRRLVARGDPAERGEHLLETIPSAELVDDESIFDERTVFERWRRIWGAEVTIREKTAGHGTVAEQSDAISDTLRGKTRGRPAVENRILHLMRGNGRAGGNDL